MYFISSFMPLAENRLALAIGDASGKGLAGALDRQCAVFAPDGGAIRERRSRQAAQNRESPGIQFVP